MHIHHSKILSLGNLSSLNYSIRQCKCHSETRHIKKSSSSKCWVNWIRKFENISIKIRHLVSVVVVAFCLYFFLIPKIATTKKKKLLLELKKKENTYVYDSIGNKTMLFPLISNQEKKLLTLLKLNPNPLFAVKETIWQKKEENVWFFFTLFFLFII